MSKQWKKLLSLIVAVIMVFSMFPTVASAATVEVTDGVSYTENSAGWVEIGSTAEFNDWFRDTAEDSITRAAAKAGKTVTAKLILKADIALNVAGYVGTDEYPAAHNITLDLVEPVQQPRILVKQGDTLGNGAGEERQNGFKHCYFSSFLEDFFRLSL